MEGLKKRRQAGSQDDMMHGAIVFFIGTTMLHQERIGMNRKYSGDIRDLFKLDLVVHLMNEIPALKRFTFVPMLTEEDAGSGSAPAGRKMDLTAAVAKGRAGSRNATLLRSMKRLQEINSDTEYFRAIRDIFDHQKILIRILEEPVFSNANRKDYFNSLFLQFPTRSLIFLDPDTGLEVKNPSKRHVLFKEVKRICDRMDDQSVLMIYQHIPRVVREGYIWRRCAELEACTGVHPRSLTDNEIVFFFLAKGPAMDKDLGRAIASYIDPYPALLMLR